MHMQLTRFASAVALPPCSSEGKVDGERIQTFLSTHDHAVSRHHLQIPPMFVLNGCEQANMGPLAVVHRSEQEFGRKTGRRGVCLSITLCPFSFGLSRLSFFISPHS